MTIIDRDITTITEGTIVHQVNCMGVMGSGVAKAIKDKWPLAYRSYLQYIANNDGVLGQIDMIYVDEKLLVVNLFGQYSFNKPGIPKVCHTSYDSWKNALGILKALNPPTPIHFPYNVGCDRGGGDWNTISALIETHFPEVIYCKWP